jgi:microcystin degradation protein MlrC
MTLRIAVAGFEHETNTFARSKTTYDDFVSHWFYRGDEIRGLGHTNTVTGGSVAAIDADKDLEMVPLLVAGAIPGGITTADAVERIEGEIVAGLRETKPDAVALALHGAMVTELADDGESQTLRRIREVVGSNVPIVAVLDLHANVTQEMIELADVLLPYNTYPHVDTGERGAEAVRLAASIAKGEIRPTTAFIKLPIMPITPKQFSGAKPTRSIMAKAFEIEAMAGVVNAGVCFAFAYADIPIVGMSVAITTNNDQNQADCLTAELADFIMDRREEFRPTLMNVEEAVHAAMEEPEGPVVLADLGDNPGGGSACDGTALLWGLLDLGAENAAFALIVDPEILDLAYAAGVGGEISGMLGAKTDDLHGYPVPITATVQSLSNGDFVYEGPMNRGAEESLGRTAVMACRGRHGNTVEVIVCEHRTQPYDAAIFRSQGIEPTAKKILVVKSMVHFRSGFGPIASRIIEVDTPGLTSMDLTRFPYTRLNRPLWPLDDLPENWRATVQ